MCDVSAVLFARDHEKIARFYREALGLVCTAADTDYTALDCGGFELIVHRVPQRYLGERKPEVPPVKRGNGRIRLDFPVDSIDTARSIAASLGGQIDDSPPAWAAKDANFYLGHDPEGNVFRLSERGR